MFSGGWLKLLGILCAAGGALVLTLGKPAGKAGTTDEDKQKALGNVFLLLNCSCMALYINIQKVFIFRNDKNEGDVGTIWKPHPVHITAWSYMFGAIAMIITAVVAFYLNIEFLGFGKGQATANFNVPRPMLIGLAYAVFISSALCYGLITFANKHLPATVVTAFWPVQVPVAVVLASCNVGIFAKPQDGSLADDDSGSDADAAPAGPFCETLTSMELMGGVLIAIGLLGVTIADHMERKEIERLTANSPPLLGGIQSGPGSINYGGR